MFAEGCTGLVCTSVHFVHLNHLLFNSNFYIVWALHESSISPESHSRTPLVTVKAFLI